jgi:CheY-like chemotaxis protein
LSYGSYDVVLSDIELGEGKMGGIEFAERAYQIQKSKGIKPMISLFSYNKELLEEAEQVLGRKRQADDRVLFHQINYTNNKMVFTASQFRHDVVHELWLNRDRTLD